MGTESLTVPKVTQGQRRNRSKSSDGEASNRKSKLQQGNKDSKQMRVSMLLSLQPDWSCTLVGPTTLSVTSVKRRGTFKPQGLFDPNWRKIMLDKSNKIYSHTLAFDHLVWGFDHKWYPLRFPRKLAPDQSGSIIPRGLRSWQNYPTNANFQGY